MKSIRLALIILVGIMVLILAGCNQAQPNAGTYINAQQEGIWVNGTGKVSVTPDLATLSLGIEAQAQTVDQAQTEASQAMNAVMNALKAEGIEEKDIQTQYFSIQQVTRYDQETQQQVVVGYRVTNVVTAKIRDLENVGTIIDSAAQAGGDLTRVNGLGFSVEDPTRYYDEVRTEAVQNAKQTADKLADLNDVSLGEPTFISEGAITPLPPIRDVTPPSQTPSPGTPVSPGEIEITLTVQIGYKITQ